MVPSSPNELQNPMGALLNLNLKTLKTELFFWVRTWVFKLLCQGQECTSKGREKEEGEMNV